MIWSLGVITGFKPKSMEIRDLKTNSPIVGKENVEFSFFIQDTRLT